MPDPDGTPPSRRPDPDDAPADDRIISRALTGSLVFLLLLASVVATLYVVARRDTDRPTRLTPLVPPRQPSSEGLADLPRSQFTDITQPAGITFSHHNGATGDKFLPETMGGGVAFFDADQDGDPDLFFVNGASWPWTPAHLSVPTHHALFRNDQGVFTDITQGSGLDVSFQGMGAAVGDFDNDGRVDLFVTGVGTQRLYRNLGDGRFEDLTAALGLEDLAPHDWPTSAAFIDFDRDGFLDLFVCHYVQWSPDTDREVDYRLVGIGRAYGPPLNFPGSFPRLYRNDSGRQFINVSATAGIQVGNRATGQPMAKSLGVAPVDLNHDGWIDLIVANDTVQNFVFSNRWDGTFAEIGAPSGIAFDPFGGTRGAMGIDTARFDEDASLGVSIGNFANEMLALYVRQPEALIFADEAITQGLGVASRLSLTFGVFFFDYDLDGWLDLLTVNGHIEDEIHRLQGGQSYRQPAQLFWNTRASRRSRGFLPVGPDHAGPDLFQPIVGRGSAFADIDGDGDLDVVLTQINGPPLLLRNDQQLGHSWIRFQLTGTRSNRDAIGAWIRLRAAGQNQWRQVMPTRGYLSQSELPVTFGLGRASRIDELEILWPSGHAQRLNPAAFPLRTTHTLQEPPP